MVKYSTRIVMTHNNYPVGSALTSINEDVITTFISNQLGLMCVDQ